MRGSKGLYVLVNVGIAGFALTVLGSVLWVSYQMGQRAGQSDGALGVDTAAFGGSPNWLAVGMLAVVFV